MLLVHNSFPERGRQRARGPGPKNFDGRSFRYTHGQRGGVFHPYANQLSYQMGPQNPGWNTYGYQNQSQPQLFCQPSGQFFPFSARGNGNNSGFHKRGKGRGGMRGQ